MHEIDQPAMKRATGLGYQFLGVKRCRFTRDADDPGTLDNAARVCRGSGSQRNQSGGSLGGRFRWLSGQLWRREPFALKDPVPPAILRHEIHSSSTTFTQLTNDIVSDNLL